MSLIQTCENLKQDIYKLKKQEKNQNKDVKPRYATQKELNEILFPKKEKQNIYDFPAKIFYSNQETIKIKDVPLKYPNQNQLQKPNIQLLKTEILPLENTVRYDDIPHSRNESDNECNTTKIRHFNNERDDKYSYLNSFKSNKNNELKENTKACINRKSFKETNPVNYEKQKQLLSISKYLRQSELKRSDENGYKKNEQKRSDSFARDCEKAYLQSKKNKIRNDVIMSITQNLNLLKEI